MNLGILDLEMTCDCKQQVGKKFIDDGRMKHFLREIISVGFIVADKNFSIKKSYQAFVKPARNSILTEYCKNLTGITQAEVDGGKICNNAFRDILKICRKYSVKIIFTFDKFDKAGILNSAKFCKAAKEPSKNIHIVAQKIFDVKSIILSAVSNDNKKHLSLSKISQMLQIENDAAKHNALNDALLLCKICKRVNFKIRRI